METATKTMIQANELRIGNWVGFDLNNQYTFDPRELIKSGATTYFRVSGLSTNTIYCDQAKPNGHSFHVTMPQELAIPIPLTPEILEKAGFEKNQNEYKYDPESFNLILTHEKEDFYYWNHSGLIIDPSIKYVHQLQNLYFALTGEELEISL